MLKWKKNYVLVKMKKNVLVLHVNAKKENVVATMNVNAIVSLAKKKDAIAIVVVKKSN